MFPISLLPVALMVAPPTLENRSEKVIDLFVRVCLKGEARFRKGEIEAVSSIGMPWPMRAFNRPGKYYQVRRPVEAWIAITEEGSHDRAYSRVYRVSAKYVDVRTAADRVRAYLLEPPLPGRQDLSYYEEYFLDGGAKFEIAHARYVDLVTLNSYILTPEAAAQARRKRGQ